MTTSCLAVSDIREWVNQHRNHYTPVYKSSEKDRAANEMYEEFTEVLKYLPFERLCHQSILDLNKILSLNHGLDCLSVKEWTIENERLGAKRLLTFGIDYTDYIENGKEFYIDLMLPRSGIIIEKNPFKAIFYFLEIFTIIYWQLQLHLSKNERDYDPISSSIVSLEKKVPHLVKQYLSL